MALVSDCPKNKTEVSIASKRLNCGNDPFGNNQYICLPNEEKTSLVELCYDGIIGLNEKGSCLEESVGKVILHNCSRFLYGCPDTFFDTNEVYKYPACLKINKEYRCYVLDPFCQPSKETDNNYEAIIYPCIGVLFVVGIIAVICLLHKKLQCRYCREKPHTGEETPLQQVVSESQGASLHQPVSPRKELPLQLPGSPNQETPLQQVVSESQGASFHQIVTSRKELPLQLPGSPNQETPLQQVVSESQEAALHQPVSPRKELRQQLPGSPNQGASLHQPVSPRTELPLQLPGSPNQDAPLSSQQQQPPDYSDALFSLHQKPPPCYSGKLKEVLEEPYETGSDFCEERPDLELLFDFLCSKLHEMEFTHFLANLKNVEIPGGDMAVFNTSEKCFKLLYDWYVKHHELNHVTELKTALNQAEMPNIVAEIQSFSKAKIVFDPNKIKQPEKRVTKSDIAYLTNIIGGNYRHVLRFLDIKQNAIEQAEETHTDDKQRIYQLMKKLWPELTRQSLCSALHYAHLNTKIDDLNSRWSK